MTISNEHLLGKDGPPARNGDNNSSLDEAGNSTVISAELLRQEPRKMQTANFFIYLMGVRTPSADTIPVWRKSWRRITNLRSILEYSARREDEKTITITPSPGHAGGIRSLE
ncbi:hypothetical protein A0H81_14354 [Grifola frondosa]|uniref:Uncharacterized protein n=1 Tax=Grifola frondosa TaxID=5627 RepID=A0A1C7LSM9_GRIFR|nr:hypothetical protein A0H81_14354 [Grifola frondosa]